MSSARKLSADWHLDSCKFQTQCKRAPNMPQLRDLRSDDPNIRPISISSLDCGKTYASIGHNDCRLSSCRRCNGDSKRGCCAEHARAIGCCPCCCYAEHCLDRLALVHYPEQPDGHWICSCTGERGYS